MPNLAIQAMGEAMPVATPTRRTVLAGLTGIGAATALVSAQELAAAAPIVPARNHNEENTMNMIVDHKALAASSPVSELPVDRVNRLAWELAEALNDYGDGRWLAEVYPSRSREWAVGLKSILVSDALENDVSRNLTRLIDGHKAADEEFDRHCGLTDPIALGYEPSKAAVKRRDRAERAEHLALIDVISYRCNGAADRKAKSKYLLERNRRGSIGYEMIPALIMGA